MQLKRQPRKKLRADNARVASRLAPTQRLKNERRRSMSMEDSMSKRSSLSDQTSSLSMRCCTLLLQSPPLCPLRTPKPPEFT
eukprot:1129724-Amphidinium_carterae.1